MKKIGLFSVLVFVALAPVSCMKESAVEADKQTTLEFAAFGTRSGESAELDVAGMDCFRIIVFKSSNGRVVCNTGKQEPSGDYKLPYELTLRLNTYDFVFITNEPDDDDLELTLDSYTEDSEKTYSQFKSELLDAGLIDFYLPSAKSLIKMAFYERVSLYGDERYKLPGEESIQEGKWLVEMKRPYIRLDLNFFLDPDQSAEFEKGDASNKIYFNGVPGGIYFGKDRVNQAVTSLGSGRYTLFYKDMSNNPCYTVSSYGQAAYTAGDAKDYGGSGWKRYSTTLFLPEHILADATKEEDAIRLHLVLGGTERSIPVYDIEQEGYSLARNRHYTYHCIVVENAIEYSVGVVEWGTGDGTQVEEEIEND